MDATEEVVVAVLREVPGPVKLAPVANMDPLGASSRTLEPAEPSEVALLAEGDGTIEQVRWRCPRSLVFLFLFFFGLATAVGKPASLSVDMLGGADRR
jgi:hypothetical protein